MSFPAPDPAPELLRRLDSAEARLRDLARTQLAGRTDPDPTTGEQWDGGQIWAHVGELIPYWIAEAERVIAAGSPDPVPFGRTKANPERLEAIERDRNRAATAIWHDVREDVSDLRALLREIPVNGWRVRGLHPTRGPMTVHEMVEEFLISHLEEHATQLEGLAAR